MGLGYAFVYAELPWCALEVTGDGQKTSNTLATEATNKIKVNIQAPKLLTV